MLRERELLDSSHRENVAVYEHLLQLLAGFPLSIEGLEAFCLVFARNRTASDIDQSATPLPFSSEISKKIFYVKSPCENLFVRISFCKSQSFCEPFFVKNISPFSLDFSLDLETISQANAKAEKLTYPPLNSATLLEVFLYLTFDQFSWRLSLVGLRGST